MKFPKKTIFNSRNAMHTLTMTMLVAVMSVAVSAQFSKSNPKSAEILLNEGTTLTQCRNGADGLQVCSWTGGNANAQQSKFAERDYIPYRLLFTGLTPGTSYTLRFGYDVLKQTTHAIDYIGTYNLTVPSANGQNNPCATVDHCNAQTTPNGTDQIVVTPDPLFTLPSTFPDVSATVPTNPMPTDGKMTIWGGYFEGGVNDPTPNPPGFTSFTYLPWDGSEERLIEVTFVPSVTNPVLAWGGHIGWQGDWGQGKSAVNISGSPYHSFLRLLNGASTGAQDVQLQANAVIVPAEVTIIKKVIFAGQEIFPNVNFGFTASGIFEPLAFDLNTSQTLTSSRTDFVNPSTFTITETGMPTGFVFLDLQCVETGQFGLPSTPDSTPQTQTDVLGPVATITAQQGERIICTFRNTRANTTAAPASISGRVATADGTGIANARMTLMNASTGETVYALTNAFGYYTFEGMSVAEFYILNVGHKRYSFADDQRAFTLNEDLQGVDFIAN